ncbi:cardiolipin synthase [Metabacillus fastidiosus]|uniref:cardiolipin synthase n=1 Tax=Metabacillus fastidiosus TaxID=1458 RepID=UPI002DB79D3F|nr:cardiolipin synthase [Metabacillus fastidiosus]MEC2078044.1 cardiolipin synthase [Metabacillus fastidiosus]
MKKRRIEFIFVPVLILLCYFVFFTSIPPSWKKVCIICYGIIILTTLFSLILENRSAPNTLLWIYVLVFIPVLGYVFYLYSGQLFLKGYLFRSKRIGDREVLETLNRKREKVDLSDLDEHQRCFAHYLEKSTTTTMDTNTSTKVLKNGEETFSEIKKRLREAKEFIHIEYYTFRSDRLGKEIMNILIAKAKEGVEVRFIYDAVGSISISSLDVKEMERAGVKVCPFLPIKSGFFNQKFNFRNHRKIIIIDGEIGFVGGLNVGVEYLGKNKKIGFWRDTHVVLKGEAVQTLHLVFLLDWKYIYGEMLLEDERYVKRPKPAKKDGMVHVVATGPETRDMSDYYYTLITCAKKSIWIASPYFIPNQSIRTALRVAAQKGIEVRVMVPKKNDGFLTQYASQSYFLELLRSGIEIYSYEKGFLHQKIIIIDGEFASIGTANMDMRSFHLNFEVNLFLLGTNSVKDLVDHYEEDLRDSYRIRPVEFYKKGMIERSKESFARLFSGIL